MLRVASINVNGVRAFARKGGFERLTVLRPDVVCLQEVRATEEQFREVLPDAFRLIGFTPAAAKGRNGVAVLVGAPGAVNAEDASGHAGPSGSAGPSGPSGFADHTALSGFADHTALSGSAGQVGLPGFEDDGRWVEAVLDTPDGPLRAVSVYVPKGYVGDPRQDAKMRFLERMAERMDVLLAGAGAGATASASGSTANPDGAAAAAAGASGSGEQVVICGDLNIARTDQDLKNWRGNRGKSGALPEEREFLERWARAGWVDLGRAVAGDDPAPYTWWSQRGRAFDNDAGWRIDYLWASPGLAERVVGVAVDRAPSWDTRWSDHAAVVAEFN